tara:strand:- start:12006 stop:12884 length:879 start_codon:yes stop_codon:yes gene_type:complete
MSKKLDAILSQYEKNSESKTKTKISSEDRLKKYFTEKLQKGVKSENKTFRILPGKGEESPFTEAYFHEKELNGTYPKTYCPKLNDGEHCPLCEARSALLEDGSEKAKELAKGLNPRKWYVVKGIDRDKEDDGVKFWRFKHKWTGDGVMDKLIPLFKLKGDITDPREGRDIVIVAGRNDKNHSVVNSIMCDDVTILTSDTAKANDWMGNDETYKDVYAKKSIEYLEIIATNKTPIWDSEQKIYVAEEDKEEAESASLEKEISFMSNTSENSGKEDLLVTDLTSNDSDDEELPF